MIEAERGIIGSLLMDEDCIGQVYNDLKPEMFSDNFLRTCYESILAMYERNEKITGISLSQELESKRYDKQDVLKELTECVSDCPTSTYIKSYATTVQNEYKSNEVKKLIQDIPLLPKDIDTSIASMLLRLEELRAHKESSSKTARMVVDENKDKYFKDIEKQVVMTGFPKLDDCIGGFENGDVIVIGARPAVGKSAFSVQMIEYMCCIGKKNVGYFNLEMSYEQVYERIISQFSEIGITRIRRAKEFLGDEEQNFNQANVKMSEMSLRITTGSKSVSEIRAESRHQKYDIIIIDYLQLIKEDRKNANRAAEVGYISKAIKSLATELHVPVILLSQLNRTSESRETKEPTMSELRESGDIEQDASIIMLMWHLDESHTLRGLKIEKNRQGALEKIGLAFDGDHVRFTEMESFKEAMEQAKWKKSNDDDSPFT